MNTALPDVSLTEVALRPSTLEWVGMQGIDLPILLDEPNYRRSVHARADVQVDLPSPHIKGIHMSRLYRLQDELGDSEGLSPARLHQLLQAMIASHQDCDSRHARIRLRFNLLVRRPALVSEHLAGWKAYPVCLNATLIRGVLTLRLRVTVTYSSTCPCSAALSRQLIEDGFLKQFATQEHVDVVSVAEWLRQHSTLATPHSQRSKAEISIELASDAPDFGLLALIDRVEQAVGTPVQTAVKRADEQAFAALNGQNLMFVEDATRRLKAALDGHYLNPGVHVRHLESLHAHDAVAWAAPHGDAVVA
ncbi:GTP cyclohydrolase FolE2 [Aeromonas caviae]|uniref:GTP cyclohydrolase FolE2 n=1 Tax=Aeromonas caviae TaxID=648 RepID=UPI000579E956|nr:GTP cyclohydrolase FolE2 [Aeromonas caviae]